MFHLRFEYYQIPWPTILTDAIQLVASNKRAGDTSTCLGKALAFLGPSPRRHRPHIVSSAVAVAGPQWSRRPPLYWGSSRQQLFSLSLTVGQPLGHVKCVLKTERIPLTEKPDSCSSSTEVSQTRRGHLLTTRLVGWDVSLILWPTILTDAIQLVASNKRAGDTSTCLGQTLAFLGPSPRRHRPHFVSSAVAVAGPQWSRRPPLYWGSSRQQPFRSVWLWVDRWGMSIAFRKKKWPLILPNAMQCLEPPKRAGGTFQRKARQKMCRAAVSTLRPGRPNSFFFF